MWQVLTTKLKLFPTLTQQRALRATQLAYRDGLNMASHYAFAHGKLSNATKLQKGLYRDLRETHYLPAQLACAVCRQDETKAARLQRYAELRWRSRANMPSASADGR